MSSVASGKRAVVEAIRAGRAREVLVAEGTHATGGMREVLDAAERSGVPVRRVPRSGLDRLASDHRGVVARLSAPPAELSERDLATFAFGDAALVVVLDGITDPQNLGAAARAADGAGAEMLVSRVRRAAAVTETAIRASAGALITLPHARVANIPRALDRLRDLEFVVVGLDAGSGRSIYDEACPLGRVAMVIGSEGGGMSRLAREHCDLLVALPMRGTVSSLNAAASLSAALFAWVVPSRG